MAKYQQYAEYKDSGVEWLGKVPEHWIISSIKYLTKSVGTGGTPKNLISFTDDEEINWFTPADFLGDLEVQISSKYVTFDSVKTGDSKLYQSGSVLMIGIGATLGKIAICNKSFSCNQQINVLVPNRAINSEYLAYALIVQIEQIKQLSNSSTIGIINQDKTKQILITLSSLDEQIQIANFLDHETAKIDSLIEKQQQLIELLKEKRQAVISHAVTKGLNPNVPMKDSGVEWLGEVPEHWEISPIKFVLENKDYKRIPLSAEERGNRSGDYRYYGASGVIDYIDDYIFDEPNVANSNMRCDSLKSLMIINKLSKFL